MPANKDDDFPRETVYNNHVKARKSSGYPELIIFDLNGTLVNFPPDKESDIFAQVYQTITDQALDPASLDRLKQQKHKKEETYRELFAGRENVDTLVMTAKKLHKEIKKSPDLYREYVLADGAINLLTFCRDHNIKIAVLTNSPQAHASALVEQFFSNFDITIQANAGKDRLNPQAGVPALEALMQTCDVQENKDVWFAGNGIKDQGTAKAANVHFCFIGSCGEASAHTFSSLAQLHDTLSKMAAPAAQPSVI